MISETCQIAGGCIKIQNMAVSIVFPHLENPENNRCRDLSLKMILENTTCPFEIMYIADTGNRDMVYRGLDFLIRNAKFELVLWGSSDVLLAKNWNENVINNADMGDWIGLELVECGQINSDQIVIDFGITADTFRRNDFENWAAGQRRNAKYPWREGFAWYSPSVFKKDFYINSGGFDLSRPFPHHADLDFRNKVEKYHAHFIVANSWSYHLQRAGENLGEKPERC